MKLARRALLKASLGAAHVGLLGRLATPARAWAAGTDTPTKLLTLFLPGGWMSLFAFCGLSDAEVTATIPAPFLENGEPIFFSPAQLKNLDGSSGSGGAFPPLRTPQLWDAAALSAGMPDPRMGTSPNGYSWVHHRLWENAVVVHGVDQMTAAHVAGVVSAMCGVASSDFKSPAVHAWAADALYARFPDRALPSVWINGPQPASLQLRPESSPLPIRSESSIEFMFSNRRANPWKDLKASDVGSTVAPQLFSGAPASGGFVLNPIEDRVSRRMRGLKGAVNPATEHVLEKLHDDLLAVSKVLARDVTGTVAATRGVELTPRPFWAPPLGSNFAVEAGAFASSSGSTWDASFDLALRLLKSNLSTSVAVTCPGIGGYGFDNGHSQGHRVQFAHVRGAFEVIGRLLGEMKVTPSGTAGKTLLDDTLVLLLSDFSRTWPNSGPTSDHWPANSVVMIGGNLNANRMVGRYDVNLVNPNAAGHDGAPVAVAEAAGTVMRRPRSADIVTTALAVMGISGIRIPGGNGEILGVRAGT